MASLNISNLPKEQWLLLFYGSQVAFGILKNS